MPPSFQLFFHIDEPGTTTIVIRSPLIPEIFSLMLVRLMICDNNKRSINLVKKKTISVWIPFDQSQLIPVIDNKKKCILDITN
ncbi:hypothetical protein DERF_009570 [Dermatophagoides farinae]|uniref:Uncharacterized protein n=1 Tax=Dermatophagoides farinae TaxID=6954 RepID=A0A922HXK9_DERFA|nr:hypothetical protein DERF_009570 [Dermatophagoides farinae]